MTPTGTPPLSWDWLSHSGAESEHVLLSSARPILDRGRSQIDIALCVGWTLAPALTNAGFTADDDVARGELGISHNIVSSTKDELAADEISCALVDKSLELASSDVSGKSRRLGKTRKEVGPCDHSYRSRKLARQHRPLHVPGNVGL